MTIRDPTAWKDDLAFYMTEEDVEGQVSAIEPLLETGSKKATAAWVAVTGTLGGAFGAVTTNPSIRRPVTFALYVVTAALLLRGLYPLTVHLLGRGTGWLAMFAFFWTSLLGLGVALVSGIDSRWIAYPLSVGVGAFIGMMYGAFPPDVARKDDPWMLSFVFAPIGAFAGAWFLRHVNPLGTIGGDAAGGAIAAGLLMVPMAVLLVKLWNEAQSLADVGQLYLHNDTFAPKAAAHLDRAIALDPKNARHHTLRGIAFARMDEPERAWADWQVASTLAPQDPEPHVQRGIDDARRGKLDAAAKAFEVALAKDPNHARAYAYLGAVREAQQDVARAFEHYDKAIALAPDDAKIRCDRSFAYLRRGEPAEALEDARRAVRVHHHLGLGHAARGHALLALGHVEEAAESFHEALDHGLDPRFRQDVLRALESLGDHAREDAEDEPEDEPEDEE
jgi:Tfp pilus assembly protein PilF